MLSCQSLSYSRAPTPIWNPSPLPVRILSYIQPVHTISCYNSNSHFNPISGKIVGKKRPKLKSQLSYSRRSDGQSVLVSRTISETRPIFLSLSLEISSDNWRFVILGRPLWREDGSVIYSFCWATPAQHFSGPCPAGLITTFYCLNLGTPQEQFGEATFEQCPDAREQSLLSVTALWRVTQCSLVIDGTECCLHIVERRGWRYIYRIDTGRNVHRNASNE
jgi:hypothetical protein